MTVLLSTTCPGMGRVPGGTSSLPVGISPARTESTSTFVIPYAARAPSSWARIRCPAGMAISDSAMSSPAGRTCCHGAAAFRIVNRSPSVHTSSIMMTASNPCGSTLPVFTRATRGRVTGCCSEASRVSALTTAIPSIAATWISGTEYRTMIGEAVIFPAADSRGIRAVLGRQANSLFSRVRASSRETVLRYRFTTGSPRPQFPSPAPSSLPGCGRPRRLQPAC